MRTIRELLRLGLSHRISARDVGRSLKVSHPTVQKYLQVVNAAGLGWPQIEQMSDEQLKKLLKNVRGRKQDVEKPLPDYAYIHQEMKKPGVTMYLLWQEYLQANPTGYKVAQFRHYYYDYVKKIDVTMRKRYKFGESMFVDYAGPTMPIYDRLTGAVSAAQIFVAVLGASNYTYAEATADQSLPSWTGSHVKSFEYFGGVPEVVTGDNLKAGVDKAHRYEPDVNPTYREMAAHYGCVVMPARAYEPRDKAKVESGVLVVERWILASLRNRKFFSLGELNESIRELLIILNKRPFKKMEGSRESVFMSHEKQALKPLPEHPWEFAQWKKLTVNMDYHVELDKYYYSVPYILAHQIVYARYTRRVVEIFYNNKRVASHARNPQERYSTQQEHMPKAHQEVLGVTAEKLIEQAKNLGIKIKELVEHILECRKYPPQGYRSCLGIIRLAKNYPIVRLENACARALAIGGYSYTSVANILKSGLDQQPVVKRPQQINIPHENIRGGEYFGSQN
ncbi:MAG: IS21 family transposase [Candidatus Omnitrophica bacterium]|nr:IS21 family transposase [Candidatus Omnitrophota bacterium]